MSQPLRHAVFRGPVSARDLIDSYRSGRERSKRLFAIPRADCYCDRPIALRNPIVFYEGHLPAFAVNTLIKLGLGNRGIDEAFEALFARGIDPADEAAAKSPADVWPSRADVQAYGDAADALVLRALAEGAHELDFAFTVIEHEMMHHETLIYMFHEMEYGKKNFMEALAFSGAEAGGRVTTAASEPIAVPAGLVTLGADRDTFGWDNEFPPMRVGVDAFSIDRHNVTNAGYLEFMRVTGAAAPHFWIRRDGQWFWRGMFEPVPLPLDAAVYATHEQAAAYARWRGKRIPTEAEYHRAAFGTPSGEELPYPWGNELPDPTRGNFDFASWDPVPVGSHPAGASPWGVEDLVGNGWEWTSTPFGGFPGFAPMRSYPQYSTDFFDNAHFVMKGASPVTARELIRRSFRNWFRPNYPYVYATFRCVSSS